MRPRWWWAVGLAVASVVVLTQVRGAGEHPEVLEVPDEGATATLLEDGTPVFVVVDGDAVRVIDARVVIPGEAVGGLVGWCSEAQRFIDPVHGVVFDAAGNVTSTTYFTPGGRSIVTPNEGHRLPALPGLRSFESETTGPGGSVQIGAAHEPPQARPMNDPPEWTPGVLDDYDGCLHTGLDRFLPLDQERDRAELPGLVTHADRAEPTMPSDGLAVVRAVLDRDGSEPSRLCLSGQTVGGRCPEDAPTFPVLPPFGVPDASLQVDGLWLVEQRAGELIGLWHLPATRAELALGDVEPVEGRYLNFVRSLGRIEVDVTDASASVRRACGLRGGRTRASFTLDTRARIVGGAQLAGELEMAELTAEQLAGRRYLTDEGPTVLLAISTEGCRVLHLGEVL